MCSGEEFPVNVIMWPDISEDGTKVAYTALGATYIKNLPDGAPQRVVQQEDAYEFSPSFSSDGKYLVHAVWNDEDFGCVQIVNTANGAIHNVTTKPGRYSQPRFSKQNNAIVFSKLGGDSLSGHKNSKDAGMNQLLRHLITWQAFM